MRADVPSVRFLVSDAGADDDVVAWDDALDADGSEFRVDVDVDDLADIMYTSGTTGLPKGVGGPAPQPVDDPEPRAGVDRRRPGCTARRCSRSPGITFIYNAMKMGMRSLYLARFDATQWLETVEQERPTMAFLVPAMAELLVAHPEFDARDLTSLQAVLDRQRAARGEARCARCRRDCPTPRSRTRTA